MSSENEIEELEAADVACEDALGAAGGHLKNDLDQFRKESGD